jgi:predicted dehydrogenase
MQEVRMIEGQGSLTSAARLTYAMAGGGKGAFIGEVHRKAIAMDGKAVPVAGCFSQSYENTLETGASLRLDKERLYRDFEEMIRVEAKRADRPDFVIVVTPNDTHYPIARLALENGFHVVCDKPLATSSRDAEHLARLAADRGLLFCVTYAYTAHPMALQMREMIAGGELGAIRFVSGEYPQEWLATSIEKTGQKQAVWRTDPARTGPSNCVGDIGTHIENMVSRVTGLEIESLCARLDRMGEKRVLDDNASIMIDFKGGAKGLYWISQIAIGHDNGFRVRIYGTKASVEWVQEDPNHLRMAFIGKPAETLSRGRDRMYPAAQALSRIPSGHPEGYFECFANLYSVFLAALAKKKAGEPLSPRDLDFPGLEDGTRGVRFIERCVESSAKGAAWVRF